MEHKTTLAVFLNFFETNRQYDIMQKLNKLKDFIISSKGLYNFEILVSDKVYTVGNGLEEQLQTFIDYIDNNLIWNDADGCYILSPANYEGTPLDMEEGEYSFDSSFLIADDNIIIYLNTQEFYASELEKISNKDIGLYCEFSDVDGDYYSFDI